MSKPLVVITGASSETGEATARAFSAAGRPLLRLARRLERMEALDLPDAVCRAVDVRDRATTAAALAGAEAAHGPADCLFDDAGIAETEVLDHVTDPDTLQSCRDDQARGGGGIDAAHVADMILHACTMPRNVLIEEMVITPTRQEH